MISLPWIALSLVTELVTELVTWVALTLARGKCWLAIMQASVWYLASVLSTDLGLALRASVQKEHLVSSRLKHLFNSGHGKEQGVGVIKQRHKLVVQVGGTGSGVQCVDKHPDRSDFRCVSPTPV